MRYVKVALLVLTGTILLAWAMQRYLIFPRFRVPHLTDNDANIDGIERLWIDIPDGRVGAWWLPAPDRSAKGPGPMVLFAHGNAESIDMWARELEPYRRMGVGVLIPEFRGYGRSDGSPSQDGITDDLVRFVDELVARGEVDPERIILHGRSLGGGVVCSLARQRKAAALVLNSTFTSVRSMAWGFGFPGFLVRDPFDNLDFVKGYYGPILIQHGTRDSLIPFAHGQALHEAARDSRLVSYDADHNDVPYDSPRFWDDIREFLRDNQIIGEPPEP